MKQMSVLDDGKCVCCGGRFFLKKYDSSFSEKEKMYVRCHPLCWARMEAGEITPDHRYELAKKELQNRDE